MFVSVQRTFKDMGKVAEKTGSRAADRAAIVQKVADLHEITPRHVRRILNGESENEEVIGTYMFLLQGQNLLLESAKKLVPFNK